MAQTKLKLQRKNDSELLTFSQQHIAAMDGNPGFTTPIPSVVDYQALHDDYERELDEASLAQQFAKQKMLSKNATRRALEAALRQRSGYVESITAGDTPKVLSSCLQVRNGRATTGPLPAPANFVAAMGAKEGEIKLSWNSVRGGKAYIIEHSENVSPRLWKQVAVVAQAKYTVTGCVPGDICVFRVAAVGTAGQGPWSDASAKMSP